MLPPIIVFDSGLGGLTVAAEIAALLPALPIRYVCDNAYFPYGTKAEADLVERIASVIVPAAAALNPILVVIACNTASTVALPYLRTRLALPIVGVVPAIKPAAALSKNRVLGLLGTPGTVARRYTDELIRSFAADCAVIRVGSVELATMAEEKLQGRGVDGAALAPVVAPFFNREGGAPADTVILACTHFPLLLPELRTLAPEGTRWVDSGAAIARRVMTLLAERGLADAARGAGIAPSRSVILTAPQAGAGHLAAFARAGYTAVDPGSGRVSFDT